MSSQLTIDQILHIYKPWWETSWIAEDGLMRLGYDSFRDPYPGQTKKTVPNDNGILFIVYYYYLLDHYCALESKDSTRFYLSMLGLQRGDIAGLYDRNPGRDQDNNSLDNYVAMVAGSVLFDFQFQSRICNYGDQNGYIFNNVDPGKTDLTDWRQGADIAFYQLSALRMPVLWNLLWLCLGFLVSAFYSEEKSSEHLLSWLRLKSLERSYLKSRASGVWFTWAYGLVFIFGYIWRFGLWRATKGKGIEREFEIYFKDQLHPNQSLSTGITY